MRGGPTERNNMASTPPRRIIHINTTTPSSNTTTTTTTTNPTSFFHHQTHPSFLTSLLHFLRRPQSLPFVLFIFLFFAWFSYRIQRASHYSQTMLLDWSTDSDLKANLVRFSSAIPSVIAKDRRGWLLDPVSLAISSGLPDGAVTCASLHVGEIRPGKLRGNHRHHDCNETFVIWGAATKFRSTFNVGEEHKDYILRSVSKALPQIRTDDGNCSRDVDGNVNLKPPTKYSILIEEEDGKAFVTTRTQDASFLKVSDENHK